MATREANAVRKIRIRVSRIIASDYAIRGVVKFLLPESAYREEKNTGAKHYEVSAQAAVEIHDDALEQLAINKGEQLRGLNIAYSALRTQIAYWFDNPNQYLTPGYKPASVDSPEPMDKSGIQVGLLFLRLSIPPASYEVR